MGSAVDMALGIKSSMKPSENKMGQKESAVDMLMRRNFSSSVGNEPLNSVFTDISKGGNAAGIDTEYRAGFVDDPKAKIEIYSKARFPDLSQEERFNRYGIHEGEIVYQGDDGKVYYETPDKFINRAARFIAQEGFSKAPEWVMSALGSYLGGWKGATGGAMAGEGIRKTIGKQVYGEDQSAIDWAADIGTAGGAALLGEGVAAGVSKGLNVAGRFGKGEIGKLAQRDFDRAMPAEMASRIERANRQGINLTVPEITDSQTLSAAYKALRGMPGEAGEMIRKFEKEMREPEISSAIEKGLGRISKQDSVYLASKEGVEAAQTAKQAFINYRQAEVSPLYESAFREAENKNIKINTSQIFKDIDDIYQHSAKPIKNEIGTVRDNFILEKNVGNKKWGNYWSEAEEGIRLKSDPRDLQEIKFGLDYQIENLKSKPSGTINNVAIRKLETIKKKLDGILESKVPGYQAANKKWALLSKPINEWDESILSGLENLTGDDVIKISQRIFSPKLSSDRAVAKAKKFIGGSNPEAWNGIVRAHLQNAFESIGDTLEGITRANVIQGGKFRNAVFGSPKKRAMLKAALSNNQYMALSDLMGALEDTVRVIDRNSDTAFKQEAIKEIRRNAGGPIAKWLRRNPLSPESLADEIEKIKTPEYAKQLADALLDPMNYKKIASLKKIPQGTRKAIATAFVISSITGKNVLIGYEGGDSGIGTIKP